MPLLARGPNVMRNLFRRERVAQDLDEKVRSYLAALVEEILEAVKWNLSSCHFL